MLFRVVSPTRQLFNRRANILQWYMAILCMQERSSGVTLRGTRNLSSMVMTDCVLLMLLFEIYLDPTDDNLVGTR